MLKIPASLCAAAAATSQLLPVAIYHNFTLIRSVHRAVCLQESDSSTAHQPAGLWTPFMVFSYLNSSPVPEPHLGHPWRCLPPAHCQSGWPPLLEPKRTHLWDGSQSILESRRPRCVSHHCNPATRLRAIYQEACQPRAAL